MIGRTSLTSMGVDGSHDLSGLGDINRSSEVLKWDLGIDGSSVEINGTRSNISESRGFSIIRCLVSVRALVNVKELTPLNGKDLSTGTGSSSDRVGSVDLSECRRDSKSEGDGFGDE